jgi:DNA-binding response OmpR family regulator
MSVENSQSTSPTILVVEDTDDLRNAITTALQKEGFTVIAVRDGEEGYVHARRTEPDLMLVDIMTPRMDGLTMIKKLREDEWGKTARIIILSNLNNADFWETAKQYHVEDYFIKADWPLRVLVQKVKDMLAVTN